MTPSALTMKKGTYQTRLRQVARKMYLHAEEINVRKWAHHSTIERQESCLRCTNYSWNYNRWSGKWWEIAKYLPKGDV